MKRKSAKISFFYFAQIFDQNVSYLHLVFRKTQPILYWPLWYFC